MALTYLVEPGGRLAKRYSYRLSSNEPAAAVTCRMTRRQAKTPERAAP